MKPSPVVTTSIAALVFILAASGTAAAQRRAAVSRGGGSVVVGRAVPRPPIVAAPGYPAPRGSRVYPVSPYYPRYGYPYYRYRYPYYAYPHPYAYGYYGYPYGFGVNFSFGFGYPYVGVYPFAYRGYPYSYYAYPYYAPYGYFGFGYPAVVTYGQVTIQGAARDGQVFVDGSYAGMVDDFDGAFQHLNLEPGTHQIEIRRANRAPLSFDVRIDAGRSITYRAPAEP